MHAASVRAVEGENWVQNGWNEIDLIIQTNLKKIVLKNMKITSKTIIMFLLCIYGFASEILTFATQFENCKSSTWIPQPARIINHQ